MINFLIVISVIFLVLSIASVGFTILETVQTIKVGEITQNISGNILEVIMPVSLSNRGVLAISDLFATASVKWNNGTLFEFASNRVTLPPGGSGTLRLKGWVNLSGFTSETFLYIMTESQDFPLSALLQLSVTPFMNVNATVDGTFNWGAPMKNLSLGRSSVIPYNSSHLKVSIPISFRDESMFPLIGTVKGYFFDEEENVIGEIEKLQLEAQPGQSYSGTMTAYVLNTAISQQKVRLLIILDTNFGYLEWSEIINAQNP
ncbi:MAG: hypothetical protein ACUVQ5_04600 [Candidatus Methanomethylicaceae archaeon]